jgi:hypothetical protein
VQSLIGAFVHSAIAFRPSSVIFVHGSDHAAPLPLFSARAPP